jgi:hypothetical protein
MKASAEKSSSTVSRTTASQPFFAKAGSGSFFAPVNRAAVPAVQAKMTVGKTGDKFEQEADKMADKVMRMPSPASSAKEEKIQRKADEQLQKAPAEEKIQKTARPEEVQKAADEKLQKKEEEALQKKSEQKEEIQKTARPEEVQKAADEKLQKKEEEQVQRKGSDAVPSVSFNAQSAIRNKTGGQPLSADVRHDMEGRFNADFSQVRVHSDAAAGKLSNQLSARAFTHRNHIFFSRNQYQPGTSEGKQLLAHELTHTIQQGHAVQRSPQVSTTITQPVIQREEDSSWLSQVGGAIKSGAQAIASALDIDKIKAFIERNARSIPGFTLLTVILGHNPITQAAVSPSPAIILQGFVELLPGVGGLISQALEKYGIFHKIGAWLQQRLMTISHIGSNIWQGIKDFLFSADIVKYLGDFNGAWTRIKGVFGTPINQLASFVSGLVTDVVNFIKDAVIRPIGEYARKNISGYPLLCAIIGSDPVTGEKAAQDSAAFIGGFLIFVGQEETWENLQKANAITRAAVWFSNNLKILKGFVSAIPELFFAALKALQIDDLLEIPSAFLKIAAIFSSFAARFISWGATAVWTLLEIIFDAVAPGLVGYIKKAGGAFRTILKNPIGFVGNLVAAGKQGLMQFASNIGKHLKAGLIKWITGTLTGVYIPQSFTLEELIKFVLSVFNITKQNVRQKLVRAIGEPAVQALEAGLEIVKALLTEGPSAALQIIKEHVGNLKGMVIDGIISFVTSKIVDVAIQKLVSMLNPVVGGIIQGAMGAYNTIMFFIERMRTMMQVVASFIDSIAAIAKGQVAAAAGRVEQTLAGLLVLAISFLARQAGLGNVSKAVIGVINKVRKPINKALDAIVGWVKKIGKKILSGVKKLGGKSLGSIKKLGSKALFALLDKIFPSLQGKTEDEVKNTLRPLSPKFKSLQVKDTDDGIEIIAKVNPVWIKKLKGKKIKITLRRKDEWPIADFRVKANALKKAVENKKLSTLGLDNRFKVYTPKRTRDRRNRKPTLEKDFKNKLMVLIDQINPKKMSKKEKNDLKVFISNQNPNSAISVEHLIDLQFEEGSHSERNLTFTDAKMNTEMGGEIANKLRTAGIKKGEIYFIEEITVQYRDKKPVHKEKAKLSTVNDTINSLLSKLPKSEHAKIRYLFKGYFNL